MGKMSKLRKAAARMRKKLRQLKQADAEYEETKRKLEALFEQIKQEDRESR